MAFQRKATATGTVASGASTGGGGATPLKGLLPDIVEASGDIAAPTILARGASGTGKTTGIAQILERLGQRDERFLLVDVENKAQSLLRYNPLVLSIGGPVKDRATGALRRPTNKERYGRLWEFVDKLSAGAYREFNGKPIAGLAGDGLMEVGDVFYNYFHENMPTSRTTGEQNTFAMFLEMGDRLLDFVAAIKEAASMASAMYGARPLAQYWTCGEEEVQDKLGNYTGAFKLVSRGKVAPRRMAFMFEAIFRLTVERGADGAANYVCWTVGAEHEFEAKAPGGLFAPKVEAWNMGVMFEQLEQWYKGSSVTSSST